MVFSRPIYRKALYYFGTLYRRGLKGRFCLLLICFGNDCDREILSISRDFSYGLEQPLAEIVLSTTQ